MNRQRRFFPRRVDTGDSGIYNSRINKFTKVEVVFDAKRRREFITGFRKRKLQRKEEARKRLEERLRTELKEFKKEALNKYFKRKTTVDVENVEPVTSKYDIGTAEVSIHEIDLNQNKQSVEENKPTSDLPKKKNRFFDDDYDKDEKLKQPFGMDYLSIKERKRQLKEEELARLLAENEVEDEPPMQFESTRKLHRQINRMVCDKIKDCKHFQVKRKIQKRKNKIKKKVNMKREKKEQKLKKKK